jgi:precorrin-3B C17-methyltransferase
MNKGKLFVVSIGPDGIDQMSVNAVEILKKCDIICGYKRYIEQLPPILFNKNTRLFSYNMGEESKRVKDAIEYTKKGNTVALVSGGDASLYGLASLVYETIDDTDFVEVVPGITAILAASARLGSPVSEDVILMSLSDLLIPWSTIERRIQLYALIDVVFGIYNPKSKKRNWQLKYLVDLFYRERGDLLCGAVKNAMRKNEEIRIFTLTHIDYEFIDMSTILIIGSSKTYLKNNKMVTPRGYTI